MPRNTPDWKGIMEVSPENAAKYRNGDVNQKSKWYADNFKTI